MKDYPKFLILLRSGICSRITQVVKCFDYFRKKGTIGFLWHYDIKECPAKFTDIFKDINYPIFYDIDDIDKKYNLYCVVNDILRGAKPASLRRDLRSYKRLLDKNKGKIVQVSSFDEIGKIEEGILNYDICRLCDGEWPEINYERRSLHDSYYLTKTTNKIFYPIDEIDFEVKRFVSDKFYGRVLGVHIRRTDYKQAIKHSPTIEFINKIKEIERFYDTLFLATDDPVEIDAIRCNTNINIIYYPCRGFNRGNIEHLKDSVITMLILSHCNFIIGSSYSQFTQAAGFYSGCRPYVVKR